MFFLIYLISGAAALLYEVLWLRLLALAVGHTAAAVGILLAAFMGGLAFGAWGAGRAAGSLAPARALRTYAFLEIGIAACALLLPLVLASARPLLVWAYAGDGGPLFKLMMGHQRQAMRIGMALLVVVAWSLGWFGPALARQAPSPPGFAGRPASAIQYLKASNPGEDDRLGIVDPLVGVTLALSADGNTLAVSAPHEDSGATGINGNQRDESAWDSGAVYVFTRNANRWTQQAYLKASNT